MLLLGWRRPEWVAGAVGLAVLVVLAPFLVRLPGRGMTAAILLGLLTVACAVVTGARSRPRGTASRPGPRSAHRRAGRGAGRARRSPACRSSSTSGPACWARGSTPTTRRHSSTGPIGWPTGSGRSRRPCRSAIPLARRRWRRPCPRGPRFDLVDVFNGLLIAIPALTALAALSVLAGAAAVAARGRGGADRAALPGGVVPGPVRIQGDGDGAVRGRDGRGAPSRHAAAGGGAGAAAGPRGGRRPGRARCRVGLHVLDPGRRVVRGRDPRLGDPLARVRVARGPRRGSRGGRARTGGSSSSARSCWSRWPSW